MPLRESLPDELIENVADLLGLRAKTRSADLSAWAEHMLQTACQRMDGFVEPAASVEAVARGRATAAAAICAHNACGARHAPRSSPGCSARAPCPPPNSSTT